MRVYGSDAIRNVAFVGHGGSGKTTLVDALAFVSGASRRHGSIKDGTTLTDYTPDEIARQHSISLGLAYAEWMDTKLNLLYTPGYLDFFGEVVECCVLGGSAASLSPRASCRAHCATQWDSATSWCRSPRSLCPR
jgi:elongation factor G